MMSFLVRETRSNFSRRSPRSYIGSPRSLVHLSISFPLLRGPSMVIIPLWAVCWGRIFNKLFMMIIVRCGSWEFANVGSPRSLLFFSNCTPGILISITFLHLTYWSRGWHVWRRPCNEAHHWSWFCCDSFFSWILLRSFRHCIKANSRIEMVDFEKAQQMIPHITCAISFGYNVSELVFGVDVFDLDFLGPGWFDQTTNQVQPWVLETCLIVGFFLLMIILIIASLSWNTYNKASWCEDWTFEWTQWMLFRTLTVLWDRLFAFCFSWSLTTGLSEFSGVWIVFVRTETIRCHQSRAGIPSNFNPASKEMILNSVEFCETEVYFLHTNLLQQMYDFQKRIMLLQKWISNPQDLPWSRSLETVPVCIGLQHYPHSNIVCVHMCAGMISIDSDVCHRFWSVLWWILKVSSLSNRSSGLPSVRVKNKHFRTIWEHTCDNSRTDFISLKWWTSMHGEDTL